MPEDARTEPIAVDRLTGSATDSSGACLSCGSAHAKRWSTPEGPALLCPPCATLHGLGCP